MSPFKKGVLTCPPKAPKIKSLAAIYAAEDARKAASNSLSGLPEESGSICSNIKSQLLDFEEISTLAASQGNDLNTDVRGTFEVSLKDLRAMCRATKKRKTGAETLEADDLDEPIIVLKAKRPKSSSTVQSKSMVTDVITECLIVQGSKGQTEEDTHGLQETLSMQTDCYTASTSSDVTSSGAGAAGSIYNLITETWGEVDMAESYLDSEPSEPLLEVMPVDISPCKVDFVAKWDSSCELSSNLIFPTNGNRQYLQNQMAPLNKPCENIAESEEYLYFPENSQNHLTENIIIDAKAGANPVCPIGNAPESSSVTCSFNSACIDAESEESFYSLENGEGSLHEDKFTKVESNVSPATIICTLPTGKNLICSIKEASMNYGKSGEILYSPEYTHNNSLQSEIIVVQNGPIAVAITENIQGGKDPISSGDEACTGDMESGRDLNLPEGSPNALHENEVTEAGSHANPETETLPDKENISASCKRACNNNTEYMENIHSLESCRNNSEESESARVEASTSPATVTDVATMDELANTNLENASNDNYGFLCEGTPGFLGSTNLTSSEGQLESIVYSAISTSKCLYKKEEDTSISVHSPPGSPTENSETDSDYRNGVVTKFGEVFEGVNQAKSTEETEKEINGVMQLYDDLEKTDIEAAKVEKQLNGDPKTTREHGPIKLLSNRTIISPTSQEKLCQALTDIELCEGSHIPKCKKSILFENCTRMKKCTISPQSTEEVLQKPKGAIKKRYLRSTGTACIKDSSAKMDTEKTIEFSRRQMHDFENVTTKLLKSMRFMRGLLEESVAVQSPWLSKTTAEEIKTASENASELERTTKRWLALMSKDCNRFCKILKSAGDSASSPPTSNNGVRNRRKIVFADEAGGTLCHVKLFSEASSSSPTAKTENADQ